MTRHIFATCGVFAIAGLTAAAQSPTTQPGSSPQRSGTGSSMTVTGCLTSPGGSSSSAASSSAAGAQYILTNAESGSGASSSSPSATPPSSSPSASRAGSGTSYVLKAEGSSANLSEHVGHKIQVTGTLDSGSESSTSPSSPGSTQPGSTAPSGQSGASRSAGAMGMQTLKVTNVTMISSSCQ